MRTWIPQSLNSKSCLCKQNKYEGSIVHVPTQSSQWNSVHLQALQSVQAAPFTTSASLGSVREGVTLQVTAICSITNQQLQLPTLPLKGPPLSPYSMPLSKCTPFSRSLWAVPHARWLLWALLSSHEFSLPTLSSECSRWNCQHVSDAHPRIVFSLFCGCLC